MVYPNRKPKSGISLLMVIIVAFLFSALSGYGKLTNYISAALVLIVLLYSLRAVPGHMTKGFCALTVYIAFYFLTSMLNVISVYYLIGTCILYTLITFGPYFVKIYLERERDGEQQTKLFKYATAIWFLIVLVSVVTYRGSEAGGRDFVRNHKGSLLGGGYGAAYASALLAVVCLNYLLSCKKELPGKVKVLLIVALVLSVAHVYFTMSTITIAAMVLGLSLCCFFFGRKDKKPNLGAIFFSVVLVLSCSFFLIYRASVGEWLIGLSASIESELFSDRLKEIGELLYASDESYHMGQRLYTLTVSWETFWTSPIFGVGYRYGNVYEVLYRRGVGVHSELLDSLAKHGLVGAIPYLYFYYDQLKDLLSRTSYKVAVPLLGTFMIMFIFNPFLSVQTIFMLCLYIPLMITELEKARLR